MPLLTIVLVLIAVGVLVYLFQIAPWIDGTFKQMIKWIAICGVVLWICGLFGLWSHLSAIRVGK